MVAGRSSAFGSSTAFMLTGRGIARQDDSEVFSFLQEHRISAQTTKSNVTFKILMFQFLQPEKGSRPAVRRLPRNFRA